MEQIKINYRNKILTLTCFSSKSVPNLSEKLKCSCHQLFATCFRDSENTSCQEMFPFIQESGCGIVVSDHDETALFLTSFIWNSESRVIEIYNVCKNPNNQGISAYVFLQEFLTNFISDNPLFPGCQAVRLALLCNNQYLVPAFITYCRLGFTVDLENQPISSHLPEHVTMSRPMGQVDPSDPNYEFRKMVNTCHYDSMILSAVYATIKHRLPTVNFNNDQIVLENSEDILDKIQFTPKQ
jgi:hypothetical protein